MRWIAVSIAALALAGCSSGEDEQSPQAQVPPQAQALPPQIPSYALIQRVMQRVVENERLAPLYSRFAISGPPPLIEARVVGDTVRYVLQTDRPARFLKQSGMHAFLWNFRFGQEGRPMVVRLLDGQGRFAWAVRYDGVQRMTVRARSDLVRCGSIWYGQGHGRTLPLAPGARDGPRCPVEPIKNASTVLR